MKQREAAMWLYGSDVKLELRAPGRTRAHVWVDGHSRPLPVDGHETLALELGDRGWHLLLFRVPRLFDTKPARGLELIRVTYT